MIRSRMYTRSLLMLALASATSAGSAEAQAGRAGVVTYAAGTVTVARASAPVVPLRFRDDVFARDRITTAERSHARLLLDGKATVTVAERSTVTITLEPGVSTVDIGPGRTAIAVARNRMRPGDVIEIRTPNSVAGIRGTVVVVEVRRTSSGSFQSEFTVLKGLVDVLALDVARREPAGAVTHLRTRESVTIHDHAPPLARTLTNDEARRLAKQFTVAPVPAPAEARTIATATHVTDAVRHAEDMLGPRAVVAPAKDDSAPGDDMRPNAAPPRDKPAMARHEPPGRNRATPELPAVVTPVGSTLVPEPVADPPKRGVAAIGRPRPDVLPRPDVPNAARPDLVLPAMRNSGNQRALGHDKAPGDR